MFLPVGDFPNPRTTPVMTYLLIAANVMVWLVVALPLSTTRPDLNDPLLLQYLRDLGVQGSVPVRVIFEQVSAYDLFIYQYGYRPADPSFLTLFTAMFLHGGWLHLIGNMLFLWIFGDNVEHRIGHIPFFFAYMVTGILATVFFAMFVPQSQTPMVGASGAISGVLGFYFLWFPRNMVKVFIFLFPFIMNTFLVPARLVLGFYLVIDNLLPFLLTGGGGGSGVAHGAHIGGFLGGLGIAWGIDRFPGWKFGRSFRQFRREESAAGSTSTPGLKPAALIHHHLTNHRPEQAAALFLRLGSEQDRRALASEDLVRIGEFFLEQGRDDLALPLFRRFIQERPTDFYLDRALLGAGRALERHGRQITSAYQYFLDAVDVARTPEVREEALMRLRAIDRLAKR
ncbi:MAG: rhomboid family intramembrane serine protease [Thermodesulfobacteriota bacterium]|jgi:membrane associated rhomboid family serine protease|nr:rhomboid family intramembrane serine protease [Thermodesulfobacteriota bacterium]